MAVSAWHQPSAGKPTTVLMKITPELAQQFLEGNTHNRPIHDIRVRRYAGDMKAGRWRLTHQGIAFTRDPLNHKKDTVLIDGQHRLYAVFESGVTVEMMVSWNYDLSEQAVIDDHIARTVRDVMGLRGDKVTTLTIAVANAMRKQGTPTAVAARQVSRSESIAYLERHREAVAFAEECFPRKMRGVATAAVMASIARAFYTKPREKLRSFAATLLEGRSEAPEDDVVIMLRNWLLSSHAGARGMQDEIYGKSARALLAYLDGERLRRLYGIDGEPFKVPGDGDAVTTAHARSRRKGKAS